MFGPHKHWEFLTLHNSDLLQIGGHPMTGFPSQYQVCSHLALNRHLPTAFTPISMCLHMLRGDS